MKTVGILFSGGIDSTYLMWKNLKEGNVVIPIYVTISNNSNKTKIEKNRIKLLADEFCNDFNYDCIARIINVVEVLIDDHRSNNSLIFNQVPIWILGLVYLQDLKVDEIQIGYVNNDDAISFIDDIKNVYYSYKAFTHKNEVIPLTFPLTKKCKEEILMDLPEKYVELTITCENPIIVDEASEIIKYLPCGECPACKRIMSMDYWGKYKIYDNFKEIQLRNAKYLLLRNGYEITDKDGYNVFEKYNAEEPAQKKYIQLELEFPNEDDYIEIEK